MMFFNNVVIFLWGLILVVRAQEDYGCFSDVNIASDEGTYTWQTPSYCEEQCLDYAYIALKNGNECYCLSSYPSSSNSVSSSNCDSTCFGYKQNTCGGSNAYEVYAGSGSQGAGTASGSSSSSPSSSSSSSSPSLSSSSSSSSSSSLSSSSLSSSLSSATSVSPSSTNKDVVTSSSGGSVVVKTVTASATSSSTSSSKTSLETSSSASPSSSPSSKKSTNVGAIAGGVVGGVAGIAIISLVAFFLIRKYNSDDDDEEEEYYDKPTGLGRGSTKKSKPPSPLDMPIANPFTHPSDEVPHELSNLGLTDPRLNPIMMGRRRFSEGSLADEADYTRKTLHVANPDA